VRDGLEITFVSEHRPIGAHVNALADVDLLVERLRETDLPTRRSCGGEAAVGSGFRGSYTFGR
jgi:hypothetical protein